MPTMSAIERAFCRSAPWSAFARRVVLPWALQGVRPRGRMLELGGGNGVMAEQTLRKYPKVELTVCDVDPAMVSAAQRRLKRFPNASAVEGDATNLPFPDDSFDVVASYLMLHHVVEWEQAVKEVTRVLRPGGTFVGYDLDRTRLAKVIHRLDGSPHRLIGYDEFDEVFSAAGLETARLRRGVAGHAVLFMARKYDS